MRRKKRIFWYLLSWYLAIAVIAVALASWHASVTVHEVCARENAAALTDLARLAEQELAGMPLDDGKAVDALCKHLGERGSARFTVIALTGRVLGDSKESPDVMDNHARRPEVRAALEGGVGSSVRYSHTLQTDMVYVALPLLVEGRISAVVRAARPLRQLEDSLASVQRQVAATGLLIALLAAAGSLVVARRLSRPIEQLRQGAERFAAGDLDHRLWEPDAAELGDLARTLNQMAAQMAARIAALTRQHNDLEAILKSMAEGVLAVDREERLITANRAAAAMLEIPLASMQGRPLQTLVRHPDLLRIVADALRSEQPVEGEIVLHGQAGERYLQAHAAALSDGHSPATGAVIVLNDVTPLRRLEQVQRDPVAKTSPERRTP